MEPLTIALLTTVLSATAGANTTVQLVLHAHAPTIAWVAGEPISLHTDETRVLEVPVNIREGRGNAHITVVSEGVTHELSVRTVGERIARPKWWLPLCALPLALLSVRVQKVVGSS